MVEDFLGSEPDSVVFHNCVIFTLVSLQIAFNLVFKLIKISSIRAIISLKLFFEVFSSQLCIAKTILNMA